MAKAIVKCLYCGEEFDRNSIPNIKIGRRYAHTHCKEEHDQNMSQEDKDEIDLYAYVKELYGKDYNYVLIRKQIETFHKQGYSFSGMKLSLKWFYEIQHHSVKDSAGIGIIPYIFEDAKKYYYNIYLSKKANAEVRDYKAEVREVVVPRPTMYTPPPHLWDLDREDLNE